MKAIADPPPGYKTQAVDTSYDAERFLFQQWREWPLWRKADRINQWTIACTRLCLTGIRHDCPDASSDRIASLHQLLIIKRRLK